MMIHYHGTPMGGKREEATRFLMGRHALVPFFYPEDLPTVAEVCQSFVLDNSAYTVWNSGGKLNVPGFIAWVREWCRHPGFDWALIPDVIDGAEAENDELEALWRDEGMERYGVPVWHLHESLERLTRLCREWRTVALGSSGKWSKPGHPAWWSRMREAMTACCDDKGRPSARLHGLRMMDPAIFTKLPLSSADSTNAAQNSGGSRVYQPATSSQRAAVIADRIEVHNSAEVWHSVPEPELLLLS